MPSGWSTSSFNQGGVEYGWSQARKTVSIHIDPQSPNDARWQQRVVVNPNTRYRLSGWIRVQKTTPTIDLLDVGANLSVLESLPELGSFTHTEPMLGSQGWRYRQVTFDTGERTWITIALRLGMYAGQTTGSAWFRSVQLTELE
ncbi:hypothetical protein FCL40_17165 [Ferrimonas sediminicola]|uniref:Carbohydrate binding domain-containing protein n=1 Tax=Ferrimonas sediminicola TaxID=2569538 RepID=A0A4U1B9T8_9GAMM|nr:hypothetical protein [Ferrimonas sediminicola]TKB46784.1 hypothetical protein FCL40_17165 [Ferrimonas sediminicola]